MVFFNPPNHPMFNRVFIINHPFWCTTIFGNTHVFCSPFTKLPSWQLWSNLVSKWSMSSSKVLCNKFSQCFSVSSWTLIVVFFCKGNAYKNIHTYCNYIHIVTVVTIIFTSAYHYCHGYFSHHLQLTLFNLTIIIGLSNIVLHEIDIVFISFLYLKFRPIIYLPSTCRKYLCNLNLFEACQKK